MDRDWLFHDSHDNFYRSPFGAVACHTAVILRLRLISGAVPESVVVHLWRDERGEERIPMRLSRQAGDEQIYEAEVATADSPGLLWYYFGVTLQGQVHYYGNNHQGLGGKGQYYAHNPRAYQITVYEPDAATPAWFKDAIVYQIFVDRFYNGNADGSINNPPRGSLIHPYWDDTPFYVRDTRTGHIFAYDFFGGNLKGVMAKLPYLEELGVTAIYFNPIFESPSNHKYDTGDYKKIDPMFGDNELFARLCTEAARRGIKVILDGVFSHTGSDSIYFNKAGKYPGLGAYQSPASPYFRWYRFSEYPDKYDCWWGIDTLPNVNELEPSYLEYIIDSDDSVLKYWLRQGVKGWRLDVADELPDLFIQRFAVTLKQCDPDAVLIGEVWEDASHKVAYGVTRQYLLGRELDSVTNYPFRDILLAFVLGHKDAAAAHQALMSLYENYPRQHFYSMLNMLGSHDVPRILTLLGEAPPPETMTIIEQARYRLPPARRKLALARLKLLVLWQMTFPGAPCIYYGDEAGMEGYTDPFNRGTYPWGREEPALVAWYKQAIGLRRRLAVLRTGDWLPLVTAGDVYSFVRRIVYGRDALGQRRPNNVAVVLFNRSTTREHVCRCQVGDYVDEYLYDGMDGSLVSLTDGELTLTLPPLAAKVLVARLDEKPVFPRSCGILLHPTALPSPYGIGDMGPAAYAFVDWLARAGQAWWQILPLNPPGLGFSPYQSVSAFAGNPLLVSPELLVADGLLPKAAIADPPAFPAAKVDFCAVQTYKEKLLRQAYEIFRDMPADPAYSAFLAANAIWLDNYALFMALKSYFGGRPWTEWPQALARREAEALAVYQRQLAGEINYYRFEQYVFYRQWQRLKNYANVRGVKLIGDLPIFISHDSCDVWANQHLFHLDAAGRPLAVAGVPPDYFSATGQLWGNPHYDWEVMAADDYRWWRERIKLLLGLADAVRIDHFRGFEAYWQVPTGASTAAHGQWVKGPGARFFHTLTRYFGQLPVIAEDLGVITPPVERLRDFYNLPGMQVLHFLFEGGLAERSQLVDLDENSVIYTGTHDNDTTLGWYQYCLANQPAVADAVRTVLGLPADFSPAALCWGMIDLAYGSSANMAMIPLQDVLALGSAARINTPGTINGNWQWRFTAGELTSEVADKLADLARRHGRQLAKFT